MIINSYDGEGDGKCPKNKIHKISLCPNQNVIQYMECKEDVPSAVNSLITA